MTGGLALLSGYISRVRREEENVLFVIAGDTVQGSLIDSEYKGISTIEIVNYFSPEWARWATTNWTAGSNISCSQRRWQTFPLSMRTCISKIPISA
ncbi:MAG: hypothetical protein WCF90_02625 [Methanomicrobiales archaeon]